MQVVYKEMTSDRAKFNLAKWNLIGGIQFKHVKNCLCSYSAVIRYVLMYFVFMVLGVISCLRGV